MNLSRLNLSHVRMHLNWQKLHPMTLLRAARSWMRLLWVRVLIMGVLALVALAMTSVVDALIPDWFSKRIDADGADRLLNIIANAMLAVTTFSLTVMVTVYRASSNQWTPRVHRLIVQDRATQNTLAVFIGAYVYALMGIVLRELGYYTDKNAATLFVTTVLVLALIVIYLIRWVLHLQTFGSLMNVSRQIEEVARAQFEERLSIPCMGAEPLTGDPPEDAEPIGAVQSGYIQHILPEQLNDLAEARGVDIYLTRPIGTFVFMNEPLLYVRRKEGAEDVAEDVAEDEEGDDLASAIQRNVILGDLRTYDQDPRFGLVVLGEVGSKALSPGVNDPGTAIDVIGRIGRILSLYKDEVAQDRDRKLPHLHVPPLDPADVITDGFAALARDGAAVVEVQMRLQSVLSGLTRHPDEGLAQAARDAAEVHLARALEATPFAPDRDRLLDSACESVRAAVVKGIEGGA